MYELKVCHESSRSCSFCFRPDRLFWKTTLLLFQRLQVNKLHWVVRSKGHSAVLQALTNDNGHICPSKPAVAGIQLREILVMKNATDIILFIFGCRCHITCSNELTMIVPSSLLS